MLHGERKTPGGKLAVVDLEVVGGRLANVTVSGDFFLEPPETLEALTAALHDAPADADAVELARRVSAAVPDGAESPAMHVAIDDVLLGEVAAGRRPPSFRFWEWTHRAVVLGRFQSVRNEIDPSGADRNGVSLVRRISGGGAMLVEPGNTITFSVYAPASLVAGMSIADS